MNSGTHLYPGSTTLITEIEPTGVQLKPETYIEWSTALILSDSEHRQYGNMKYRIDLKVMQLLYITSIYTH